MSVLSWEYKKTIDVSCVGTAVFKTCNLYITCNRQLKLNNNGLKFIS